jgi:hypothetical protein
MDPDFAGALTLTLIPGTGLYQEWRQGAFELVTPLDSLRELKTIVEHSIFSNCFFSSMHASNYFAIRGTMPGERVKMLKQLQAILTSQDPRLLRPEYMRGL